MTEDQMRKRMSEIDTERERLACEKKEYEKYFADKKHQDTMKSHEEYIGKCFVAIEGLTGNKHKYIKAFRILGIVEPHHENYAVCVAIIDGHRDTIWREYGTQITTLGLWNPNEFRMIFNPTDCKMIDFYKEISQKEFEELYCKHVWQVENRVYMYDEPQEIK